jgi:hypothetical protein
MSIRNYTTTFPYTISNSDSESDSDSEYINNQSLLWLILKEKLINIKKGTDENISKNIISDKPKVDIKTENNKEYVNIKIFFDILNELVRLFTDLYNKIIINYSKIASSKYMIDLVNYINKEFNENIKYEPKKDHKYKLLEYKYYSLETYDIESEIVLDIVDYIEKIIINYINGISNLINISKKINIKDIETVKNEIIIQLNNEGIMVGGNKQESIIEYIIKNGLNIKNKNLEYIEIDKKINNIIKMIKSNINIEVNNNNINEHNDKIKSILENIKKNINLSRMIDNINIELKSINIPNEKKKLYKLLLNINNIIFYMNNHNIYKIDFDNINNIIDNNIIDNYYLIELLNKYKMSLLNVYKSNDIFNKLINKKLELILKNIKDT